jgi:hypothetical protein
MLELGHFDPGVMLMHASSAEVLHNKVRLPRECAVDIQRSLGIRLGHLKKVTCANM